MKQKEAQTAAALPCQSTDGFPLHFLNAIFSKASPSDYIIDNVVGFALLLMGFAALLSNEPNPEIM